MARRMRETGPATSSRHGESRKGVSVLKSCSSQSESARTAAPWSKGFTFPLNPKWVLADKGWKEVYDKLMSSQKPNVQDSLSIWYPPEVQSKISEISTRYPEGFRTCAAKGQGDLAGVLFDLAQIELRRCEVSQDTFLINQSLTSHALYLRFVDTAEKVAQSGITDLWDTANDACQNHRRRSFTKLLQ